MVSGLESLMKNQQLEISDLKQRLKEAEHYHRRKDGDHHHSRRKTSPKKSVHEHNSSVKNEIIIPESPQPHSTSCRSDSSVESPQKHYSRPEEHSAEERTSNSSPGKRSRHRSTSRADRHHSRTREHSKHLEVLDDRRERVYGPPSTRLCDVSTLVTNF